MYWYQTGARMEWRFDNRVRCPPRGRSAWQGGSFLLLRPCHLVRRFTLLSIDPYSNFWYDGHQRRYLRRRTGDGGISIVHFRRFCRPPGCPLSFLVSRRSRPHIFVRSYIRRRRYRRRRSRSHSRYPRLYQAPPGPPPPCLMKRPRPPLSPPQMEILPKQRRWRRTLPQFRLRCRRCRRCCQNYRGSLRPQKWRSQSYMFCCG